MHSWWKIVAIKEDRTAGTGSELLAATLPWGSRIVTAFKLAVALIPALRSALGPRKVPGCPYIFPRPPFDLLIEAFPTSAAVGMRLFGFCHLENSCEDM